jgi:methionine-gamma-lyase
VAVPPLEGSRPIGVPLYQNAIFAFDDPEALAASVTGPRGAFAYTGYTNPTVRALEDALADLEGGAGALATCSGMAAINTVLLSRLRQGDHVVAQRALYGATVAMLGDLERRFGIETSYIAGDDAGELRRALRPNSRMLLLETIANPIGQVPDLPALTEVAANAGLITVVDNTLATPLLCQPLRSGADIVLHSTTKYLAGHNDVVGGAVVFADAQLYRDTWAYATKLGTIADPFSAWLIIRGLQTVPMRIQRACDTAALLADHLAEHPAVRAVHYPGLTTHPSHKIAARVLSGFGGTLAFDLAAGPTAARTFMTNLKLVDIAGSLGGVNTLAMHPATSTHRHVGAEELAGFGISPETVRLAVGIEHPDDLWADLEQALGGVLGDRDRGC